MALVITEPVAAFDLSQIERGDLIWAKHQTWDEGKAGFVTSARSDQLIAQYHPGIGNVTNHFIIPVSEAAANEWGIRWSRDMADVHEYNIETEGESDDES